MNDCGGFRLRINKLARKCFKMHSGRYGCIEALFPKSNATLISVDFIYPSRTYSSFFFHQIKRTKKGEKKP